jgi:hypothetical protein
MRHKNAKQSVELGRLQESIRPSVRVHQTVHPECNRSAQQQTRFGLIVQENKDAELSRKFVKKGPEGARADDMITIFTGARFDVISREIPGVKRPAICLGDSGEGNRDSGLIVISIPE